MQNNKYLIEKPRITTKGVLIFCSFLVVNIILFTLWKKEAFELTQTALYSILSGTSMIFAFFVSFTLAKQPPQINSEAIEREINEKDQALKKHLEAENNFLKAQLTLVNNSIEKRIKQGIIDERKMFEQNKKLERQAKF